ncbi:cytosolic purine 5'-nucleotidase isoform X2 [Parasteatoda tepidariorum]|uniref:cytosolic purine 5'-nucleotidase isoform X2 n=1 Tax=Parasteatoda tepidariorum TaxID=114398 RepID=UPI001C725B93|nr:cytosolic purine 5'-nucleotidase isoform X2 [Parasteatoda tepidariorum]
MTNLCSGKVCVFKLSRIKSWDFVINMEGDSNDNEDSRSESVSSNTQSRKFYRATHHRIFVNRSLHLEKIKFFGFDMDYTLAQYKNPEYEALQFQLIRDRLVSIGYPPQIKDFQYDPAFPIRGLWFDKTYGTLNKVDAYGNILVCIHGFKFLKTSEIYNLYPNKFLQLDEKRVYVMNTLFNLPEAYLLACLIDYFTNSSQYIPGKNGIKSGNIFMSYTSIFQDVRDSIDWVHMRGSLKDETVNNPSKYLVKEERLPMLFDRMHEAGKKSFLLTNSDYAYTAQIMSYLFDVPSGNGRDWKEYFDYIVVDAKKPGFFGEGTILRQVDTETGSLKIGIHVGPLSPGQVYSGGSSDVFKSLIKASGKDVLYVGDHIYGDILKSKKSRGWRTFLVVPELQREVHVWTSKCDLFLKIQDLDVQLGDTYKEMDSSCHDTPDISQLKSAIREITHELDMSYGILGSTFRSERCLDFKSMCGRKLKNFCHTAIGSRQTHFASQICHYADLYASTFMNLMYYPFSFMFRAPPMLMPHESTVQHEERNFISDAEAEELDEELIKEPLRRRSRLETSESKSVPHLFAETPNVVTHHHDTDDDEDTDKSAEN